MRLVGEAGTADLRGINRSRRNPGPWLIYVAEAAALQVGDVDFLRRTLTVSRQVQRGPRSSVEIRAPKFGSERTVYLADGLVEILAAHVAGHCPGDDPRRYLFGFGKDEPPHNNGAWWWWRNARQASGCSEIKLHSLCHYYASGLIAAGCDVVTVQRALGHGSATITLDTYAH
jgi:integrase